MLDKLSFYFQYSFVWYAIIVGVFISICSALIGIILVLRKLSFMGDSLSHVAFGAAMIAGLLKLSGNIVITLIATILCAVILLRIGNRSRGDALLAVISVSSLAIGYLAVNVFGKTANLAGDVCSTLFGSTSILTLSISDVFICSSLACIIIILFIVFYSKIVAITFDETFLKASGFNTGMFNTCIAVVIAVVIVLAMNLVGSLLITALVIFPVLSAMCINSKFKTVTILSVILSVICTLIGIISSIYIGTPVGSTIVAIDLVTYLICIVYKKLTGG